MLNLIRMEMYRLSRGKAFYICLGTFSVLSVITFLIMYAIANPEVSEKLIKMGFTISTTGDINGLRQVSIVEIFHQIGGKGGIFALIVGCLASTMVGKDFDHGFIKNILSVHENKWRYILSKIISVSILNLLYITISFVLTFLVNGLLGSFFVVPPVMDILFFGITLWFLLNGFTALIMMIYIITLSNGITIASSILLSSGTVVTLVGGILSFFGAEKIINYTLYMNMGTCPYQYIDIKSLQALAIGTICLILYTVVAKLVLAKRDL